MSGDIHAMAALPLQNEPPICAHLIGFWVQNTPAIDALENRKFLPQLEIKPWFFDSPFHNSVTTATELSRLQYS